MVLYASSLSNLTRMAVLVIYGIFAPNTWRRLLLMTAGVVAALLGVEAAIWADRLAADRDLFISNVLITLLAVFLGVGTAMYGSFKLGSAQEEAVRQGAVGHRPASAPRSRNVQPVSPVITRAVPSAPRTTRYAAVSPPGVVTSTSLSSPAASPGKTRSSRPSR